MTLTETLLRLFSILGVTILLTVLGYIVHEGGHIFLGWICGGDPHIGEYRFGIPSYTTINEPRSMANWQVRITGGFPILLLILCGIGIYIQNPILLLFGLGGGISISALDMVAVYHPEAWKQLASGESVTLDDFKPPSLTM